MHGLPPGLLEAEKDAMFLVAVPSSLVFQLVNCLVSCSGNAPILMNWP